MLSVFRGTENQSSEDLSDDFDKVVDTNDKQIKELYKRGDLTKIIIEVRDSGVGITKSDQTKLFKVFGKL